MLTSVRFLIVGSVCVASGAQVAVAALNPEAPSINGTAETLRQGNGEIGLASFSYGLTDELMLTVPTLPLLFGEVGAGVKYRFQLSDRVMLTPGLSASAVQEFDLDDDESTSKIEFVPRGSLGLTVYLDSEKRHSLSLNVSGGKNAVYNWAERNNPDKRVEYKMGVSLYPEYDYYTDSGNLFWIGAAGLLPVYGFTWAWEHFHVGLGAVGIIPFPYFYWRF